MKNKSIKGIMINNTELKLTQLADDTTLFIKDINSLQAAFQVLDKFSEISGLKLNKAKTEVMVIGKKINLQRLGIKQVDTACSLGIIYNKSTDSIIYENHRKKLDEITKLVSTQKHRKLSLYGKATVIKNLAVPKLNHVLANLFTPEWFIIEARKCIFDFLWDGKPPKIRNNVVVNTSEKGGLKIPELSLHAKAQKISWVKRIINNPKAAWMQLFSSELPEMHIQDILKCTIDPKELSFDIPAFYRQVLLGWYEIKTNPKSATDIRRECLWHNKNITINGNCTFSKSTSDNPCHKQGRNQ